MLVFSAYALAETTHPIPPDDQLEIRIFDVVTKSAPSYLGKRSGCLGQVVDRVEVLSTDEPFVTDTGTLLPVTALVTATCPRARGAARIQEEVFVWLVLERLNEPIRHAVR